MESKSIADPADELRNSLRSMWGSVAPGWRAHADFIDKRGAELTRRMLEAARPQPAERALELACGPGSVGIAAAPLVAEIVISDVAPEMTEIAAERAAARGLANVQTRTLDLEAIDAPDATFDVVLCREGLMLVSDPARAAGEIRRVLRPEGRAAISVWGPRGRNPWLGVVFDAVSEEVGAPIPPAGLPGPFSLDDAERFATVLEGAGLREVSVTEVEVPLLAASFDEWWSRTAALAGPMAAMVAGLPEKARQSLLERLQNAAAPYATANGLEFPGVVLLAGARR
jgi:SAM-dependent methyltransferase